MSKSITKIVKATLGLTMAIGAGVGAAFGGSTSNKETIRVQAAENDTHVFNSENSDIVFSRLLNNDASIDSVSIEQQSYTVKRIVANVRYNKTAGGVTVTPTIGSTALTPKTHNANSTVDLTWDVSPAIRGAITFDFINNCGSGTGKGTFYFNSVTLTEGPGAGEPTITGVSVTGNMSKTSYTTVDRWSNAGLTATENYSDSSTIDVTSTATWTYTPHNTPASAVIANSNNAVTGYSLTATATSNGQSGNKQTTGVSVSIATVAQLASATPAEGSLIGVIARGIVSEIGEMSTSSPYFNATYYISDDGSTENQYEVFRGKGVDNANITNVNDIKVGDVVVVFGNITTYKGTKEFEQGNYLLSLERAASSDPDITITESNFTMFVGDDDVTLHETHENVPDGGSVKWVSGTPAVATINVSTGVVHAVAPGTSVITAKIVNGVDEMVASNSITVTVVENVLTDGDTFIIKATHSATDYYLTGVTSSLGTTSTTASDAMVFTAIEGASSGQFQFKNGDNFLSYSGSSNNLYTTTDDEADSTLWTAISNGSTIIVESVKVSGRKLQFNYNSGNSRFACYTSNQEAVSIEKVVPPEVNSVTVAGDTTADANNALSIVKEFLYDVTYVDPLNPGNSSVDVTVLNSSDGTDGASITSAPNGTSFSVTFTASDTYTITVTSHEDLGKSDSMSIVVSNICVPPDYELYEEATLVEGDYVIYYSDGALKNTIASNRAQYEEVTPVADAITTNNANIIWHIAKDGDYYTIYNASVNKYLASTDSNNQAKLETTLSDNSRWTVEVSDGKYEFINKARADASSNNKYLRKNTTYGFACYANGTGGALSLYRLNDIKAYLSSASTVATLTESILRLGSTISAEKWNSIAATAEITDYGVMIYKTDSESNITSSKPVENAYRAGVVLPAIARKGNGVPPSLTDGNYVFTARIRVSNPDTIFCSASFIVAGGQYYFFNEQHVAASELAS